MQVSKLRKYASMLDVVPSALEGKLHLVTYVNRSIFATFTAMSAHNSQWRWCVPPPTASRSPAAPDHGVQSVYELDASVQHVSLNPAAPSTQQPPDVF